MQLERLRSNNSKLVAERDAALERVAKAEESAASQADEADAARIASHREVVRLTTTTEQQGKLINHLLNLLPAEHRGRLQSAFMAPSGGSSENNSGTTASNTTTTTASSSAGLGGIFVRSQSRWLGGAGKSSTGHSALFTKTKSMLRGGSKKASSSSSKSSVALGPFPSLAETKKSFAFKSVSRLRRSSHGDATIIRSPTKRPHRGRRMAAWVRTLSTLRSKKHIGPAAKPRRHGGGEEEESEEEGDAGDDVVYEDPDGGVYIGDGGSLEYPVIQDDEEEEDDDVNCVASDMDYFRGSASELSSPRSSVAPSMSSLPENCRRVMWAGDFNANDFKASKPVRPSSFIAHSHLDYWVTW